MTTERKADTEIEITPKMVDAGVEVIAEFRDHASSEVLAEAVYRAMASHRPARARDQG